MAPWATQLRFNLHPLLIYTLSIKTGRSSSQNEIYDIGTKILNLQCLNYSQNQTFCKSIIPEDFESSRPLLSFASVKTRFKAFWDIFSKKCMRPWIRRLRIFYEKMQNVNWLNTSTDLRCKRHNLHAPKYD